MKLDLVEKRKTFYLRALLLVLFLVAILILVTILSGLELHNTYGLFIPLIFIISLLISPYFYNIKIGTLEIEEKQITIIPRNGVHAVFPFNEGFKFNFVYNGDRAKDSVKKYFPGGVLIKIQVKDGNENLAEYKFVVKDSKILQFIELLKKLYKTGLPIRETDEFGAKWFLLRSNLKYEEIQKIKSEYNLIW